jgi:hypothetical protein
LIVCAVACRLDIDPRGGVGVIAEGGCGVLMASTPFGVSAGRFTLFGGVSRRQIQSFRRSFLKERGRSRQRLRLFWFVLRASSSWLGASK